MYSLRISSPILRLPFNFVDGFLCCAEAFPFDVIPVIYFCFLLPVLLVLYPRKMTAKTNVKELFPLCFLTGVLWFHVLYVSLIHFEWIFMSGLRVQFYSFALGV